LKISKPIDIVYIHSLDLSASETSETFVVNNVLSLAKYANSVELVAISRAERDVEGMICKNFGLDSLPGNLKLTTINTFKRTKLFFYLFVRNFIRNLDPKKLVITRSHGVLKWLFFLNKPKQKLVFETHDFFYSLSERLDGKKTNRIRKSKIEHKYFQRLNALISSNDFQGHLYSQYFSEIPVRSFPTGLRKIYYSKNTRHKKLAFIGSLEPRQGLDRIVSLINYLDDDISVIIVGGRNQDEIDYFKSLFQDRGILERIEIFGWLNKEKLFNLLKDVRFGLMPVYIEEHRYSLPLKLYDYFAIGIPVITSQLESIKNIVIEGSTGFYTDWENPKELSRLIKLKMQEEEWDILSDNVYKMAEKITWDLRAKNQIEFYRELM
jgi:glycosyltransferase involved in cell wall biosynthesis